MLRGVDSNHLLSRVHRVSPSGVRGSFLVLRYYRAYGPYSVFLSLRYMRLQYRTRAVWKGHGKDDESKPQILALAMNPDGQWLLSGGLDGFARLWSLKNGELLGEISLGLPIASLEWPLHRREFFYAGCSSGMSMSCSVVGTAVRIRTTRTSPVH